MWGSQQYFRIQQQGATLPFIRSAGFWAHEHGHIRGLFTQRVLFRAISADYTITETDLRTAQTIVFNITGAADRWVTMPSEAAVISAFGSTANATGHILTVILRYDSAFRPRMTGYRDHNGAAIGPGVGHFMGIGDTMQFMFLNSPVSHWQVS